MKKNLSLRLLLADKDKEITRLKKELEEEKNAYNRMYNMYVEKDNIINELEKYLRNMKEATGRDCKGNIEYIPNRTALSILSYIQELKGSDKE